MGNKVDIDATKRIKKFIVGILEDSEVIGAILIAKKYGYTIKNG